MIHTRIQLDPQADVSLRGGADGTVEILVLEGDDGDASAVIEMTPKQLAAICEAASTS